MAQQNFNFQELARQLGLKNVSELPIVEAITPTIVIGAAEQIGPPLLPASAFTGAAQSAGGGRFATIQLRVLASGGAFVTGFHSGGTIQSFFRVDRDGVDPVAGDPVVTAVAKFETGFGTTLSAVVRGASTIPVLTGPVIFNAVSMGNLQMVSSEPFFVPSGGLFTLQSATVATTGYFSIHWREVPAPALNPPPD